MVGSNVADAVQQPWVIVAGRHDVDSGAALIVFLLIFARRKLKSGLIFDNQRFRSEDFTQVLKEKEKYFRI